MKIILQKDYPRLGSALDVLEVKDGYGRNYLIPQGIAAIANKGNLAHAEEMKKFSAKRADKAVASATEVAKKIAEHSCTIVVKLKGGEDIYGSVSVQDIAENLKEAGIEVGKSSVLLAEPIKKLGVYEVPVKLHKQITETLKVWVVKKEA